jgi:hypothetical protein
MHAPLKQLGLLTMVLAFNQQVIQGQAFDDPGQYMSYISEVNQDLSAKYLFYMSAVSHGKSARKVEKRRMEVLSSIIDTRMKVQGMPPWKGDRTLRDTSVGYYKILYSVFNEDYGKIVNMEEIAEQSYDAMEAYMLAQDKAYEKLDEASARQYAMQKAFAAKYSINLVEGESEISSKSKVVREVLDHTNQLYLIFFKCYKQESYLNDAIAKKNLVAIDQSISTLKKFATEGGQKLATMKGYMGDASLITACQDMMNYYQEEADKGSVMSDFVVKQEDFSRIKRDFDKKPEARRTQEDVDQYNKAVADMNNAVNNFNLNMKQLSKDGSKALDGWNKAYNNFLDEHMPRQKKQ